MPVNVNSTNPYASTYGVTTPATTADTKKAEEAAAEEAKTKNEDTFVKSSEEKSVTYKPDYTKIREMKASMNNKMGAFQQMVQSMFGKQVDLSKNVMQQMQDLISGAGGTTGANPAEDFYNDPEWGVEAVANRLVDFAKALSGGDPAKAEMLRDAVKKGFEAAGAAWGGEMPDITGKTFDRTMELFDEWVNGDKAAATETEGEGEKASEATSFRGQLINQLMDGTFTREDKLFMLDMLQQGKSKRLTDDEVSEILDNKDITRQDIEKILGRLDED